MKRTELSRITAMAQTDQPQKRQSPKTPTSPTIEQLLREGDGSWWSTPSSASSPHERNHDQEEDHGHHQRKSMLTKVKEKAKKLRHSLSTKKKHSNEDENTTPAWGVSLEDDEDEEEDAEYLGAPMYESELAPESYKETARQHPRANPVISEKHVLPSKNDNKNDDPDLSPTDTTKPTQTTDQSNDNLSCPPQNTITEAVREKLAPALETVTATVSEATHSIASKIQGLSLNSSTIENSQTNNNNNNNSSQVVRQSSYSPRNLLQTSSETGKNVSSGSNQVTWDKGVSMKDYLLNKFEPGEEDRVLSRAISDAVSPRSRKTPNDQMSVVDKVREAVTSLLRNDQPRSPPSKPAVLTRSTTQASSRSSVVTSTNAREVVEEKSHGRILQTN